MKKSAQWYRGEMLNSAPLQYAPRNELGVVFLFPHIARRLGITTVEKIQAAYPDCLAYVRTGKGDKSVRIEFEYRSRNFYQQRHDPKKVDWIVCWEHNWPDVPKNIRVVELRKEYGLGFNVWVQPVSVYGGYDYKARLSRIDRSDCWSVPSRATEGDLVLFYRTRPDMCIADIFELTDSVRLCEARWKAGKDYMGPIRRICRLKAPLYMEEMRNDRILKTANFIRGQMQGRPNVSEYWPVLLDMIVRRNPSIKKALAKYSPEAL